eukprot:XP_011663793.1 PREDICTED: allatostatin-A receptor-like [Strongylocentrotus purpuratus]
MSSKEMSTSAMTMMTASRENVTCMDYLTAVVDPEDCDFMTTSSLVFVIVSIILIIWGLFNNILLLLIIFTNGRQMRTIPNIFIANMAFLGILFLVIVSGGNILLFGQIAFHAEIIRSESVSSALFFIQIFVSVASFTTLVVLGLDRYLAIVHPLRSRPYRTKKRAVMANCLVWIIAGLTMIPVFLAGGSRDVFQAYSDPGLRKSMIIFITFAYVLPIILLVLMYVAILKVIWFNPTTKQLQGEEQARRWKQRIQVLKSLSRVVLSFIVHYGYFFAVFLWLINGGHTQVSARVSNVLFYSAILILYLNTCLNPVIYALKQEAFRPFVYKLLCPKTCNLRKPEKGALNTATQPNGNASEPKASKTLQNGQEGVVRTSSGRGSTGVNLDGNMKENVILPNGIINEGYHGNDKTRDKDTEIGSSDATSGDVIATSYA